jgi:pentose-5-phosphate-3-epimerase
VILKGEDLVNAMGDLVETTFNVHLFVKTMDKYLADYANAN